MNERDDEGYLIGSKAYEIKTIRTALERIADAQEKLLSIAEASQKERNELSDKMKQAFRVQGMSNEAK